MKARIPQHREFIINFPESVDQAKASEGWNKLTQIVEDYKKAHNGASVYSPPSRSSRRSMASSIPSSM